MLLVNLARINLGFFPTPLQELGNLSRALGGSRIWVKREDLSGLASGGNKVRHLEFVLADIKSRGIDTIISTSGSTQSNFCLQLAAAAHKLNMHAGFVFYGEYHPQVQGNLLLHKILNSKVKIIRSYYSSNVDKELNNMVQEYLNMGHKPVIIKYNIGSASGTDLHYRNLAVVGWAEGAEELLHQLQAGKIDARYLIVSAGSCITSAGLILGLKFLRSPVRLIGITASITKEEATKRIIEKANTAADFMSWDVIIREEDITIYDEYRAERNRRPTRGCLEAMKLVAQTEGFFLDPVYTGPTMAGLIDLMKKGIFTLEDTIVFFHTGGFPAVFTYDKEIISSCETDD